MTFAGAVVLGLSLLTACGDDGGGSAGGGGDYCESLKSAKKQIDGAGSGDLGGLEDAAETIEDLKDEAPDEIKDDWEVLYEGFKSILDAFEEAGIDAEDLEAMQKGEMPEGVDLETLQAAMSKVQSLDSPEFQEASDAIAKHAKDECGVDLEG